MNGCEWSKVPQQASMAERESEPRSPESQSDTLVTTPQCLPMHLKFNALIMPLKRTLVGGVDGRMTPLLPMETL